MKRRVIVLSAVWAFIACSHPIPETIDKKAEAGNAEAQYQMSLNAFLAKECPKTLARQSFGAARLLIKTTFPRSTIWASIISKAKLSHRTRSRLGTAYWYGAGVKSDYTEAVKWYLKAAEQGDAFSQHALAEAYAKGMGVKTDYVHAHMWANLATVSYSNVPEGQVESEKLRASLAYKMTPKQIEEAEKMAKEWKPNKQTPLP
jgi:hypothetical protein